MSKSYEYYSQTFSQREGRSPLPEPMRLEHLSSTFRNEVWFCIDQTILKFATDGNRELLGVYRGSPISVFIFFYIRKVVDTPHDEIMNEMHEHRHLLKQVITKGSYDSVLTFIEMFLRYPNPSHDRILSELWEELKGLFERVPVATVHDKIMRGNVAEGALWAMRALSTAGSGPAQTALPCLPH